MLKGEKTTINKHNSMPKTKPLKIDGSTGEGGGQIIRSALSLSMLTGMPIEMTNIRAGRAKPGLMRQHLVCVEASQAISDATVSGAHLGSTAFSFTPNSIKSGDYSFDIGSAGSTSLVLQTLLPALLFANSDKNAAHQNLSVVTIKGGTHNPMAPTTDFLQQAFIPALAKLGMQVDIERQQAGFAPIGGGVIQATINPFKHRANTPPFKLTERGELVDIELVAHVLNLDDNICTRELAGAKDTLIEAGVDEALISTQANKLDGIGKGNACYALVSHKITHKVGNPNGHKQHHHEVFSLLGQKRISAEAIGNRLAELVKRYLFSTDALIDEHLTNQLLLPLALSGGGTFTARVISAHTETQAWLIEQFLPVEIQFSAINKEKTLVQVIG